ncbi:F-box protein CPR1-like isoform X2 [Cornus florida]|uniref:F-box protein CPR1-like isoform X2 n=1 Tax=Cornus florida TaxID=4283 RepID=UPI00289B88A0|nr:F-box protein CPR1-like isoform X2 [Cornus florida]
MICSSTSSPDYPSKPSYDALVSANHELELPLKDPSDRFLRIIGSCNGLVCLVEDFHGYGRSFYLWNPSIRKTITLPPLRVSFQSHSPFMHSVGFGFDARTDDYKVVRIVHLWPPDDFELPPEIDIFSLSTGTWRNISHLGLQYVIYERAPQAYLNGSAHWLAYNRRMEGFFSLIVSFHMGDEIFGENMVPAGCTFYSGSNARVAKFQESLSLIDGIWGKTCSIWVMKEYGIADSWTKQFNIDTSVGFESVVGFTRKGEVLLGLNSGYLVAYDPDTERVLHLNIRGTTDRWCMDSFYGDAYTKSLVLLGAKLPNTGACEEAKKSKKRRAKHLYPKTFVISCIPKHL